jgi:DNA-binding transcriptional MerR regulator
MEDAFAEAQAELGAEVASTGEEAPEEVEEVVGEEAELEAPVEDTPEAESDTPEDTEEFDGPPSLDIDEFADYTVTVKIDGEERQVPLSEALSGYMRQADYTKKTQSVAVDRNDVAFAKAFQTGMQSDPIGTLRAVAEHYGVTGQKAQPQPEQFDDPLEQQVYELQQQIEEMRGNFGHGLVEQEVSRLSAQYDDFADNLDEIINEAVTTTNGDLDKAYRLVMADKWRNQATEATKRAQSSAAAKEAKRKSQVVSSSRSSAGKPPVSDEPADKSFEAAYEWAIAKHGSRR